MFPIIKNVVKEKVRVPPIKSSINNYVTFLCVPKGQNGCCQHWTCAIIFKLNFRCIENKYTFNTIREAKEEDTVGNLISTVLDTDSIDCMMIDHVVSGLTEDSATFQTSLNTPIEVLKQFNFKSIIVNLVKKGNERSDAKNPLNAFQILMDARRRYDKYPPLRYVI